MNRFTELVGVRLPIQQAGMSGAATAELAAAVSNAGALGMIGVGRQPVALVERYLDAIDTLTTKPFGVTCIAHLVRPDVEGLIADRARVMEFFYDWPTAARVPSGKIVGWQVGSLEEAVTAADAGCSYIIVQGVEAGGHVRGYSSLAPLLAKVRDAVDLPIVAAGGIGTAAQVRDVMAMGADAVRVGTRFVATVESNAHPEYINALIGSGGGDTELTEAFGVGWPNAPHRVLRSALAAAESAAEVVATMNTDGAPTPVPRWGVSLPTRDTTGDIKAMALYAGQSVEAVHGTMTAADVVAELANGLSETFRS
jgi:NAD(P)H-dependent flavin oxidoreductase YrpB (nitropropane dioxygenase family)